jgi:hypothetical protein
VRLPRQVAAYNRVLDRATLVTVERHLDRSRGIIPEWWGIILASSDGQLKVLRESEPNPSLDAFSVAQLLWRDEALNELRIRGAARGLSNRARYYVWEALVAEVELDELRCIARRQLTERLPWPAVQ